FADPNVADSIVVQVSGLTLAGTASGNYTLTQPTTTADITAAPLTVTGITAADKVYDGGTTATLNTTNPVLVGVVGSDDVTVDATGAAGTFADPNVADSIVVQVSGLTLAGTASGNYTLTQPTTTAGITPATPTVSVTDAGGTYSTDPYPAKDASVTGVGTDGKLASFGDPTLSYSYYSGTALLPGAPTAAGADTGVAHDASNNPNYTN